MTDLEKARVGLDDDLKLLKDGPRLALTLRLCAVEYLQARLAWSMTPQAQRADIDAARTRAHDAFLASLNAITRAAAAEGATLNWRKAFAVAGEVEERKRLGDFACYLAFRVAVAVR
jgi:hypothetical protein